ncbi:MAG: hypothetical protein ACK47B_02515 [Armatimonadota bacterium]
MASHTIKVTGVSDELLQLLDERIQAQHSTGRSEYIRELIRKDVLAARTGSAGPQRFREILAPVHEETARQGYSDEEIDGDIEEAIQESRAERREAEAA